MKLSDSTIQKLFLMLLATFVGTIVIAAINAPKITRVAEEPLNAAVILVEAFHHPSTTGIKVGYHMGYNGKMTFGTYVGNIDEENSATFSWPETGERFQTSNREVAKKLSSCAAGTKVNISYRKILEVKTKNGTVIEKGYVGLEVLGVELIN